MDLMYSVTHLGYHKVWNVSYMYNVIFTKTPASPFATDYCHQWSTHRFIESQSLCDIRAESMVVNELSDAMVEIPEASLEVTESTDHGHGSNGNGAEDRQDNVVAVIQSSDDKLMQVVDGLGSNLHEFTTSLVQENWHVLNKAYIYEHNKVCLLHFGTSAVMWPKAMQCDLVQQQKIFR